MTLQRLTCSCGHSWNHSLTGTPPENLREICPICTLGGQSTMAVPLPGDGSRAPTTPGDLVPGRELTGFEIIEELNRGGMGIIYKARQKGLNRVVALKVIMPERLGHTDAMKRFQREVQAAALLSHPNIVTVFHTELHGARPFLAMEFVAGIDLHKLVKQVGPLPASEACGYVLQAAHGLQHAFEQGLVHRDIKPANLMVTPSPLETGISRTGRAPRVKILDMGLARLTTPPDESSGDLTQAGEFLGTPDFIAPEQAEDSRQADIRSDLYSLGSTLFFLLTGEVPFPTGNVIQKLRRQLTEPPPSPAKRRADVPAGIDQVVRRLMALDPAARYQTPAELITDLEAVQRNPSAARPIAPLESPPLVSVPAPPSRHTAVREIRAHPGGLQSLSLSADGNLVLTGGIDQMLRVWGASRLQEIKCITGDVGPVEQAALAPGGKWAASCSLRLFKQDMVVQVWDLANGKELRRLKGATDNIRCVTIAPDGRRVAAGGADRSIRIWAVDQPGSPFLSLSGHTGQINSLAFLPSGDSLLSGSNDGTVRLWDTKTGTAKGMMSGQVGSVTTVAFGGASKRVALAGDGVRVRQADGSFIEFKGHQGPVLCVAFSPDGQWLVTGGSDQTVRLWRADNDEERHRFNNHTARVCAVAFSPDGKMVYSGSADGILRQSPVPD